MYRNAYLSLTIGNLTGPDHFTVAQFCCLNEQVKVISVFLRHHQCNAQSIGLMRSIVVLIVPIGCFNVNPSSIFGQSSSP
jgi:hypothetical protein